MNKSESIKEITQAVIKVMAGVKGIEKNLTVGSGSNTYKGVADQDVKKIIGDLMADNGLCILPIGIDESTQVDSWEETGGQYGPKRKQSVFTKVTASYMLCHISGEWIELKGYGHGVDSQDKSAGKATTYALKYALLYTFMVPTGKIDDTDEVHSDNIPVKETVKVPKQITKEALTPIHPAWEKVVTYLKGTGTMTELLKKFTISKEFEEKLINETLKEIE
jgi:hypothetical protein